MDRCSNSLIILIIREVKFLIRYILPITWTKIFKHNHVEYQGLGTDGLLFTVGGQYKLRLFQTKCDSINRLKLLI